MYLVNPPTFSATRSRLAPRNSLTVALLLLLFAFATLYVPCYGKEEVERPVGDGTLEFMEQVYLHNRELFHAFTCRFRILEGHATDITEAVDGRLTEVVAKTGLWISDGGDGRYELLCDEKVRVDPPNPETVAEGGDREGIVTTVACLPLTELYSNEKRRRVDCSRLFNLASLQEDGTYTAVYTPISMGIMGPGETLSPAEIIRGARQKRFYCRHSGVETIDGSLVDVIETGLEPSPNGAPFLTFYLDVRRGCVPLRAVFKNPDGSKAGETIATSIRKCENGGYICDRAVLTWTRRSGLAVTVIELVDLDLSRPPRDSLALSLNVGTEVVEAKDLRSLFKLDKQESMHIDDFDRWSQRCRASLDRYLAEVERREHPGHTDGSQTKGIGGFPVALVLGGLFLSVLVVWVWMRSKKISVRQS